MDVLGHGVAKGVVAAAMRILCGVLLAIGLLAQTDAPEAPPKLKRGIPTGKSETSKTAAPEMKPSTGPAPEPSSLCTG